MQSHTLIGASNHIPNHPSKKSFEFILHILNSLSSRFDCNHQIRSQFCTCHNRSVMACAKLWPDQIIDLQVKTADTFILHVLRAHKPLYVTLTSQWKQWHLKSLTSLVYSTVVSDADQRKHQSSSELHVTGLCAGNSPVNFPHKRPVMQKMFPFDDIIMKKGPTQLSRILWSQAHGQPCSTN